MTRALAHRGPDSDGVLIEGAVGFGHRRLSILDLSDSAAQPMRSADRRFSIVFNGEIYNFRALRAGLEARGVRVISTGDTEVVLALFQEQGERAFAQLNGMFALAIWDHAEERLTLARDRFGQKPLYFAASARSIVFGSEIKSLLASGLARPGVDHAALHEYCFFGSTLGARTLFAGVEKLTAGEVLTFDRQGRSSRAFWRIDDVRPSRDDVDTATSRVRSLLDDAVKRHLVSDVPVGVFLSGGVDSSAVTLLAARHLGAPIASYSVGFDFDPGELPRAAKVARLAGADHHELTVRGANLADVVRDLVRHHDQPFGDAANIPLYLLARELRGQLKVVLQGDGGDEMFAGYRRYNVLAHARAWHELARARPLLGLLPPHATKARIDRFLRAVGEPDEGRRMALLLCEDSEEPSPTRLLSADLRGQLGRAPFARYLELNGRLRSLDPVQRMLHTDCSILLPDIFCEKVDRATMAHSLEVRLPFLDNELTSYVLGLPSRFKVRRLEKKWLLRRALRGIVPDEVLDAPKRGFGVPYGAWLRGPLRPLLEETLLTGRAATEGWLDREACRRVILEHTSSQANHGFLLYKTLELALWYEAYQ